MRKPELTAALAEKAGLSRTEAGEVLNAILDEVSYALSRGERVTLPGLGSWSCSRRAARSGINPRTGQSMQIPASQSVRFSAAAALKEAVKNSR